MCIVYWRAQGGSGGDVIRRTVVRREFESNLTSSSSTGGK